MHDFCEKSQSFVSNSSNCISILENWEKPKYSIGELVEYQTDCVGEASPPGEEKYLFVAVIMGCEYFPRSNSWEYYINYRNGNKKYEFIDDSQIGESQIIRSVILSEI